MEARTIQERLLNLNITQIQVELSSGIKKVTSVTILRYLKQKPIDAITIIIFDDSHHLIYFVFIKFVFSNIKDN